MTEKTVRIAGREIGPGRPTYVIAEIGSNHNQDLALALDMIAMAAKTGADAVKFQSIRFDQLYQPEAEDESFRKWFEQIELNESWYAKLAAKAHDEGVDFLSAPTYEKAIDLLEDVDVPAYKLASPQVQGNLAVVRKAAMTGKPLIMSMGYCEYAEIEAALAVCRDAGNRQIIPLHCISKYPMAPGEGNLSFIRTLSEMTQCPVGFSDHSLGPHLAIVAVALGACIIEKHVTMDRSQAGPDHHFAMTFGEFSDMVEKIREVEEALGSGQRPRLLEEEYQQREAFVLKAFANKDIAIDEIIDEGSLTFLRASQDGIGIGDGHLLFNRRAVTNISSGQLVTWAMIGKD